MHIYYLIGKYLYLIIYIIHSIAFIINISINIKMFKMVTETLLFLSCALKLYITTFCPNIEKY